MEPVTLALGLVSTALGIASASQQRNAEEEAAKQAKEVGKLQAQQYVSELFLAQAQGYRLSEKRLNDHKQSEAQNFAYFASMERFDQSIDRYLERQKEIANKDVGTIERQLGVTKANLETQASVAWKYGQNEAAGIRAQSNANLISNIGRIAENFPITMFQSGPQTPSYPSYGPPSVSSGRS